MDIRRPIAAAALVAAALPLYAQMDAQTAPGQTSTNLWTWRARAEVRANWRDSNDARFTTRFVQDGYLEEDGEVWDSTGRLVALSRQLAIFPRSAT